MTTEADIRSRLLADDRSALALIWDAWADDLLALLIAQLRSRSDAEDALQDLFVTIARKRTAVARADNLKSYIFRMARNIAVNRVKQAVRQRQRHEHVGTDWLEPATPSESRTEEVTAALNELPDSQRLVIVMKFFRARTFREIASLLDISENTAGSRYRYGMEKLRNILRRNP